MEKKWEDEKKCEEEKNKINLKFATIRSKV